MAPPSTLSPDMADHSARRTLSEEETARGRHSSPATVKICRESKRKHAAYAQDEQRRYSNEIWEDIPHMSEIESDHGFRPAAKDVFGPRGQKSLFAEVCQSSTKRIRDGLVEWRQYADRRRPDGHPTPAGLFRSRTASPPACTPSPLGTHPPRARPFGVPDRLPRRASAAVRRQ